jgi:hypothetical protein
MKGAANCSKRFNIPLATCGWVDYVQWAGSPEPPPPPPLTKWQKITYLASPAVAGYAKACKYDPAGRRIEKTFDGKYTVKYLYDGDDMIAEYHGSGKLLRKYIYGPRVDEPIRLRSGQAFRR